MTDKRVDAAIAFLEEATSQVALLLVALDNSTWVEVNDTPLAALRDFKRVLFVVEMPGGTRFIECGRFDDEDRVWRSEVHGATFLLPQVTHWRPMPELPPKRVKG